MILVLGCFDTLVSIPNVLVHPYLLGGGRFVDNLRDFAQQRRTLRGSGFLLILQFILKLLVKCFPGIQIFCIRQCNLLAQFVDLGLLLIHFVNKVVKDTN